MDDQSTINVIKGLVIDGVHKAQSGHPGGPMSSLDFAYILFTEYLHFDPDDHQWLGRDRFILSAGHESMLLYSLLYMIGWLNLEDLKHFRQLHSKTPGHPENYLTPGIECTTGPLGQGAAMSVGFSIGALHLQNALDKNLFNYKIYGLLGDGCIQEDVTLGAASLAGHLHLNNLLWFYDRNAVQISGHINRTTSEDERQVFEGFGWYVQEINGHDHNAIRTALDNAHSNHDQPHLIIGNTVMAKGSYSMEGNHEAHGAPFKTDERLKTKEKLNLPKDIDFYCPDEAIKQFQRNFVKKKTAAKTWHETLNKRLADPHFKSKFNSFFADINIAKLTTFSWKPSEQVATRNVFGKILETWADQLPNLVGGSADLEPSNMTVGFANKVKDFSHQNRAGRNLVFGVREFPMAAISNGLALHGGFIPFDATFLTFSDYARPAIRLGALQKIRVIHEFSHDSFYLGEDGPTHQPIEHLMTLRAIPNFYVMRPADPYETETMMRIAIKDRATPCALCLTRQKVPVLDISDSLRQNAYYGAYEILVEKNPEFIILATGSEVHLALAVTKLLAPKRLRVVSMPCFEIFERQTADYKDQLIPPHFTKIISIEAGSTLGWQKYTGKNGLNIGIDHFGDSAPAEKLAEAYGFTPEKILARIIRHTF